MLTLAERYEHDGVVKGVSIGANRLAELIKGGLSVDDALHKVNEEQNRKPIPLEKE